MKEDNTVHQPDHGEANHKEECGKRHHEERRIFPGEAADPDLKQHHFKTGDRQHDAIEACVDVVLFAQVYRQGTVLLLVDDQNNHARQCKTM